MELYFLFRNSKGEFCWIENDGSYFVDVKAKMELPLCGVTAWCTRTLLGWHPYDFQVGLYTTILCGKRYSNGRTE